MQHIFSLILSLLLAYGVAALGSFFTVGAIDVWYATLLKPALSPPNWLFGPVWTILYALMAIAAWRVYQKPANSLSRNALILYGVHLVLNALWSIVFFGFQAPILALSIIIALLVSILVLTILFYRIDKMAGLLFLPYLAWVSFATYLNFSIVFLN